MRRWLKVGATSAGRRVARFLAAGSADRYGRRGEITASSDAPSSDDRALPAARDQSDDTDRDTEDADLEGAEGAGNAENADVADDEDASDEDVEEAEEVAEEGKDEAEEADEEAPVQISGKLDGPVTDTVGAVDPDGDRLI